MNKQKIQRKMKESEWTNEINKKRINKWKNKDWQNEQTKDSKERWNRQNEQTKDSKKDERVRMNKWKLQNEKQTNEIRGTHWTNERYKTGINK